jgi:hypothetical protein
MQGITRVKRARKAKPNSCPFVPRLNGETRKWRKKRSGEHIVFLVASSNVKEVAEGIGAPGIEPGAADKNSAHQHPTPQTPPSGTFIQTIKKQKKERKQCMQLSFSPQ